MGKSKFMIDLSMRIGADIAHLKRDLGKAKKQVNGFKKTTMNATKMIGGMFAGQALISGIATAIKKIAELENKIKRVALITGGAEKEFADLAKQLGSTTKFTAIEAAEAMQFLAQAGFDSNEVLAATPGILDLAAASQTDLATAADITSNILSGFGMAAGDVGKVNDILVTTTNSANTSVIQMGEAFKMVAPIAKSAGLAINDAAGFIGVLGDAGIQGTMAGTQLKGAIAALINPTAKGTAVLEKLGVQVQMNNDGSLDLAGTLVSLKRAGMSTKDAFQLFNKISAAGALVMSDAAEKAMTLSEATKEVGVASKQAKEQMNTLQGDMDKLSSAWDALILNGGALNGIFRSVTQDFTDMVSVMGGGHRDLDRLKEKLAAVVALGPGTKFAGWQQGFINTGFVAKDLAMEIAKIEQEQALANIEIEKAAKVTADLKAAEDAELATKKKLNEERLAEIDRLEKVNEARLEAFRIAGLQQESKKATAIEVGKVTKDFKGSAEEKFINDGAAHAMSMKEKTAERMKELGIKTNEEMVALEVEKNILLDELATEEREKKVAAAQVGLAMAASVMNTLVALNDMKMNKELAAAGDNEEEKQKIRKKYGEKKKKMAIAQALINGALGATQTFASLGYPLAIPFMIAGAAMTAIQVGAIASQKFAEGGIVGGGMQMVGERGKELVKLPSGSQVHSNQNTMKMLNGSGQTVMIPEVRLKGEDIYIAFTEAQRKLGNTRN